MSFYSGDRDGDFMYVCTREECYSGYGEKKVPWIRKAEVVKCDADKKTLWGKFFCILKKLFTFKKG